MCATTSPGLLTVWIRRQFYLLRLHKHRARNRQALVTHRPFALQGFNQFRAPTIARQKPL